MANIGGKRWTRKHFEAVERARKRGAPTYLIETARTFDIQDTEPTRDANSLMRSRRYAIIQPTGAFIWKST